MMQASDLILGLLIIFLVGWTVMLAVSQRALDVSVQALSAKQATQAISISPSNCKAIAGYELVSAPQFAEKEYYITAGFNADTNQPFLCFYSEA